MIDVFNSLTESIKKFSNIYIMTHKSPDLDGLGSSIGLYTIITSFKKNCYLIDTKENKDNTIEKMYRMLQEHQIMIQKKYEKEALKESNEDTLLIVLDVHKSEMVESPKLLNSCKNIIVIDHHIKGNEYIKTTDLCYINSGMSSINEFMAYYLKHLNKKVDPLIATIMITGIEIDTSNYKLKTTEKTYEASAILTSMGADPILKQELLKENKEQYLKRNEFVKQSYMLNETIAICILDECIYSKSYLAEIAEQLLQFDNIEASFCIGKIKKDTIGVSARSIGNIDVESIMSQMGGGGHLTDAATQIKNTGIKDVEQQLIGTIKR